MYPIDIILGICLKLNAETIFKTCISLLDEGIVLIQKPGSTITLSSDADLIHKGDTAAWLRTAHAMKARLLNQLSETSQYSAANIFTELAAAYTTNDDDAYITTFDVRNPWNDVALDNAGQLVKGWLSKYYVDAMDGTIYGIPDPRLPLTASLTKDGTYVGTRNGAGRGSSSGIDQEESYVSLTGYYSGETSPLYIISYDEMKFIEAEAAFLSNDKPRAYAAYIEGITANMNKMGVDAAARDAYINDPPVSVGEANRTRDLIFKEKYKALFLMPVTWDDARRFDYRYRQFELPLNVVTSTYVRRLVYPSVETTRNSGNVPQVTDVTLPLWWDQ